MKPWIVLLASLQSGPAAAAAYAYAALQVPGATGTRVTSINDAGVVAGMYEDARGRTVAFTYANGVYATFSVPGATTTEVWGLSDTGFKSGRYSVGGAESYYVETAVGIMTLQAPANIIAAYDVNSAGQVVGSYLEGGARYGFVALNGVVTRLDAPGATSITARSINDAGEVAGDYYRLGTQRAFLWRDGVFTDLPVPGATQALGLSDTGTVVGYGAGGAAFSYSAASGVSLLQPGGTSVSPLAVNSAGVVAGFQQVVVGGVSRTVGFLATPVPEPASLALLAGGLGTALLGRRGVRRA